MHWCRSQPALVPYVLLPSSIPSLVWWCIKEAQHVAMVMVMVMEKMMIMMTRNARYVDDRAMQFSKPMVDSGTLGAKGNTQVRTQCQMTAAFVCVDQSDHVVAVLCGLGVCVCVLSLIHI